jgi:protein-L-isoaspartate(D-aspartate) O-methyltransferase
MNRIMADNRRLWRARERMIKEQLLARGICDERVLRAMGKVPRHAFVPEALRDRAYDDNPLPIGEGQTISQPYIVALMTQLLNLKGDEKILEIGTGSGYQTAILAELGQKVFSIERSPSLSASARAILEELGYSNVLLRVGDGSIGWEEFSPYDRIIVTAAAPSVPPSLGRQLADNGVLVIPVGDRLQQTLTVIRNTARGILREEAGGVVFVPLVGREGWTS